MTYIISQRVMRMSAGDHIYCCVNGKTAVCSIDEITSEFINTAIVEWVEASSELPVFVTIASGLPKGDKLELIFQKELSLGQLHSYHFKHLALS